MHILIVDDDPIIHKITSVILEGMDIESIDFAFSGEEAISKLHGLEHPYDCFLVDIQMPGINGVELVGYLRERVEYQTAPILMITSETDRSYVDGAFQSGATDFVNKPLDSFTLRSRMNSIIQLVEQQKEIKRLKQSRFYELNIFDRPANLYQEIQINDVDGCIDYLRLENYLLYLSRSETFDMCAFGVSVNNIRHLCAGIREYEYRFILQDIAEILSDVLKPSRFMFAHAGGGSFAGVTDLGRQFNRQSFLERWSEVSSGYELFYGDGRPFNFSISVSSPVPLIFKSQHATIKALRKARSYAEMAAGNQDMPNSSDLGDELTGIHRKIGGM